MLRLMRDYATSWMIKFILGAIVVVFVFWGVGSFREQRASRVATVNDRVITIEDYRESYNNMVDRLRQNFGNRLDDEMLKLFNVREQALNQLIDQALLIQKAELLNLAVTDAELAAAISSMPVFQRAGVFDNSLYQRVLSSNRLTTEQFEISQRNAMLAQKAQNLIASGIKVSDPEAMEWYRWQNASVNVAYVQFKPSDYADIEPSEAELVAFFESDPDRYKTEPKVSVRYIKFDPKTFLGAVAVPSDEIESYYRSNPKEFTTEKTVQARHILLKLAPDAPEAEVDTTYRQLLDIREKIAGGASFEEMARQYSEGPSAERGGDLGAFKHGDMVKPFSDAAFALGPGQVSEPVRTRFGWHLITVEQVNPEKTISLADATEGIRDKLAMNRARTLAYDEAEAVYDLSFEGDDLIVTAEERDLELVTTDPFPRSGPESGVGNRAQFAQVAFDLPVMEISDIQDFGDGYYVMQVVEKNSGQIPDLETVRDRVRADVVANKQQQQALIAADSFLSALKAGAAMAEESQRLNLAMVESGFFKRDAAIPDIGQEPEFAQAAFTLSGDNPLTDEVVKGRDGYYVIRFIEQKPPDPAGFEAQKPTIVRTLMQQKRQQAYTEWLAAMRNASEITINQEILE